MRRVGSFSMKRCARCGSAISSDYAVVDCGHDFHASCAPGAARRRNASLRRPTVTDLQRVVEITVFDVDDEFPDSVEVIVGGVRRTYYPQEEP